MAHTSEKLSFLSLGLVISSILGILIGIKLILTLSLIIFAISSVTWLIKSRSENVNQEKR